MRMKVGRRKFTIIPEKDEAVSMLMEYVMLAGVLIVFMFALLAVSSGNLIENPTKATMKAQFMDVGNQIANKLVDIALIAPENGNINVKVVMPYTVGDDDFKVGFEEWNGNYYLKVKSDRLNRSESLPISNLGLEMSPEGFTYSLSLTHQISYSRSNVISPTAVALAYPTKIRQGENVTFDMTYSTGEGSLWFTWEFGDGDTYSGNYSYSNPLSSIVSHGYAVAGNYTANLTVTDAYGDSDTDSVVISVEPLTPDPFLFIDKFIIPKYAEPNEDVKIMLYIRGGGVSQQARNVSTMHVIDTSGSMDPDYYSQGWTNFNSTTGSVSPSKWTGFVAVTSSFKRMMIDAYSTGKDVDLWVKSPDGDFARAQFNIVNGERYYVYFPESGDWEIAVVADYPTGSDSVSVDIYRKTSFWGPWKYYEGHNFELSANSQVYNFSLPSVEDMRVDLDLVNGTKDVHFYVDDGSLHGPYDENYPFTDSNAGGDYTVYFVADFPYGSQEYSVDFDIAKIDAAKIAAKNFNSLLKSGDLVGVAYFNGTGYWGDIAVSEVVQTLTSDIDSANSSIESLSAYGGTPMGDGIWKAKEELIDKAPSGTIPVIVLLSDGNPTLPDDGTAVQRALDNATDAKSTTIHGEELLIYTIGFGSDANETLLREVATSPSYYYYAATSNELSDIYGQIARDLKEKSAENLTITDVLPPNIQLTSTPSGANITTDGGNTILRWNISSIRINETWTSTFYVRPSTEGIVQTNVFGLSNVTYIPYPFTGVNFTTSTFPVGQTTIELSEAEQVGLR